MLLDRYFRNEAFLIIRDFCSIIYEIRLSSVDMGVNINGVVLYFVVYTSQIPYLPNNYSTLFASLYTN